MGIGASSEEVGGVLMRLYLALVSHIPLLHILNHERLKPREKETFPHLHATITESFL